MSSEAIGSSAMKRKITAQDCGQAGIMDIPTPIEGAGVLGRVRTGECVNTQAGPDINAATGGIND